MVTRNEEREEPNSSNPARYWDMVVRRRWWLVAAANTGWALALALSLTITPKYRSESLLLIEQQKIPTQYVTPNVTLDVHELFQGLTEEILSRNQLAQIIDELHLYGKPPGTPVSDALIARMRGDFAIEFVRPVGVQDVTAFKVAYSAPDALMAQQVTARLASLFINENVREQQELSRETTSFLASQVAQAKEDLEVQEKALGEFRSKYLGQLPEQLTLNMQILGGLQSRLQSLTDSLHGAEQQRLYLMWLANSSGNSQAASGTPGEAPTTPTAMDEQIQKMKSDLAGLLTHYSPKHPDVIQLREQISNAEKLRRDLQQTQAQGQPEEGNEAVAEIHTVGAEGGHTGQPSAAVQIAAQLRANELEIANRKQEIKALETQIEEYQARLNQVPLREQQMADLTRNHEQSQANYQSLLAKKQQSDLATNLSKQQQGEQFRTIDPPTLPTSPYWPNRLLLAATGLVAGLGMGFGLVLLAEAIDPRVCREDDLRKWIHVPLLATIPAAPTLSEQHQQNRLRRLEIACGSAIAMLMPVVTLVVYWKK
jgi:polysaccharide chain length determinant protein (PEP-CTERM system associated)